LDCYEARYVSGPDGKPDPTRMRWLRPAELHDYPLSTTGRKLSRLVELSPAGISVTLRSPEKTRNTHTQ